MIYKTMSLPLTFIFVRQLSRYSYTSFQKGVFKGQLISKCIFGVFKFFQKNERKQFDLRNHISRTLLIQLFFVTLFLPTRLIGSPTIFNFNNFSYLGSCYQALDSRPVECTLIQGQSLAKKSVAYSTEGTYLDGLGFRLKSHECRAGFN